MPEAAGGQGRKAPNNIQVATHSPVWFFYTEKMSYFSSNRAFLRISIKGTS